LTDGKGLHGKRRKRQRKRGRIATGQIYHQGDKTKQPLIRGFQPLVQAVWKKKKIALGGREGMKRGGEGRMLLAGDGLLTTLRGRKSVPKVTKFLNRPCR